MAFKLISRLNKGGRLVILACGLIGGSLGVKGPEIINYFKTNQARATVERILDANGNKRLDEAELKRFYDETGLNPYTTPFKSVSRKDLEKFINNYELRYVRK